MICCCSNVLKMCQPVNTCADSELLLPYTGLTPAAEYTFRTDFLASVIEINLIADGTGKVTLPTANLNENYNFIGGLYDTNGSKITVVDSLITYDCISFQTKPFIDVN
jgi:hypothetical protein